MHAKLILISAIALMFSAPALAEPEFQPDEPAAAIHSDTTAERVTNAAGIVLEFAPALPFEQQDIWQRIKTSFQLEDFDSPLTQKHEDWYASRPDYMQRMIA